MNILLGITGSVATTLTEKLKAALAVHGTVKCVGTDKSRHFTKVDVLTDEDEWSPYTKGDEILHIELRKWADVFIIAPLSANTMAKLSHGLSDNLLTSVARAWDFKKPILVAPAMNTFMWEHPATAEQVAILQKWGYHIIDPTSKVLACGDEGMGAMAPIPLIVSHVFSAISN